AGTAPGLSMAPELEAAVVAAGTVAATGALGALAVWRLGRRRPTLAAATGPAVIVVAVAAGVLVTARAMLINQHDVGVIVTALAAALPVALVIGGWLAARLRELAQRAADEAAARATASELEQARRDLVAGVSHDLRTPLAGIRAMAESLEDGVADDPPHYLARIRAEVDRMDTMVGNLLDLSRLQGSGQALRRDPVDLHDLVSDAVASARLVGERSQVCVTGAGDRPLHVTGDGQLISRAVANLLTNAVRHTPAGSSVTVTAHAVDGAARIEVADGCGGFPRDVLPLVCDAGFRGEAARTPTAGVGAGLGLALVREIALAHCGDVSVANIDGGCRFVMTLAR
ncbi:MAG: HAMP domain-containing sensor histidine kinase, partial [Nocardioides sp.]